jgi:hypothetical protein
MRREFLDATDGGQFRNASGATIRESPKVVAAVHPVGVLLDEP